MLQLKNEGTAPLTHLTVRAVNAAANTHASYRLERLGPGETVELGWQEWNWSVDPDETYAISADGYLLSITFTSAQLGVR